MPSTEFTGGWEKCGKMFARNSKINIDMIDT